VLLALLAIVGNEIVEHSVWDERQLANGDILSAALVVLTTFAASYFIGCRQRSQFVTFRAELTPLTPPDDA
jgi:hypothetical protein